MRRLIAPLLLLCPVAAFVSTTRQSFLSRRSVRQQAETTAAASSGSNVVEGLIKTISQTGQGDMVRLGDIATVKYSCYLPDGSPPFARSTRQKVVVGDGMIDGWERAIRTMRVGERSIIRIVDSSLAYGQEGVPPLVPADATVEIDLEVLDSQPATANIDFDSLAIMDMTPRTASDISAAYEERQAAKANDPKPKEGFAGMLEKAKDFYFFGLFEGETGEKAPWFLRPSITFPLAFAVVGAAFYVSILGGAITNRGAQVTDELDEIILSSSVLLPVVTAMMGL
jgi:hypothetical protein